MPATFNMSDVMISYSRRDKAFVQRLNQALQDSGRAVWVDWEDIPPTADWWSEIQAGIEAAHTFVFIISPESVRSEICRREIDHAIACNKRLVPVLYKEVVDEADKAQMHPALNTHNWIYLRDTDDFAAGFKILVLALETDLQHVQTHTRLLVRANEWEFKKRPNSFLLRGEDLRDAEAWLRQGYNKLPVPTALQADYVEASRAAANRLRTTVIGAMSAALVILSLLACFAFSQANLAQTALSESNDRGTQVVLRLTDVAQQAATSQANANLAATNAANAFNNAETSVAEAATSAYNATQSANNAATATNAQGDAENNLLTATNAQGEAEINGTLAAENANQESTSAALAAANEQTAIAAAATSNYNATQSAINANQAQTEAANAVNSASTAAAEANQRATQQAIAQQQEAIAQTQAAIANANATLSAQNAATANANATLAQQEANQRATQQAIAEREALVSQSLALAGNARAALAAGDRPLAIHLGLLANSILVDPPLQADLALGEVAYAVGARGIFRGHNTAIEQIAVSKNGRRAASLDTQNQLFIWDIDPASDFYGQAIGSIDLGTTDITSMDMSPDGTMVIYGSCAYVLAYSNCNGYGGMLAIRDVANPQSTNFGKLLFVDNDKHFDWVESVAFSPDGKWAVSAYYGKAYLWNAQRGPNFGSFIAEADVIGSIPQVVFSADSQTFIISAHTTPERVFSVYNITDTGTIQAREPLRIFDGIPAFMRDIALSPNKQWVLYSLSDGRMLLWDLTTKTQIGSPFGGSVVSVAFSDDGKLLVSGSGDGSLHLWNMDQNSFGFMTVLQTVNRHTSAVVDVAFGPKSYRGSYRVFSGSTDASFREWDTEIGNSISVYHDRSSVASVALAPNEQSIVSASERDLDAELMTGFVNTWNIAGDEPTRSYPEGINPTSVGFIVGSNRIIWGVFNDSSIEAYGGARLWDLSLPGETGVQWWLDVDGSAIRAITGISSTQQALAGGCTAKSTITPYPCTSAKLYILDINPQSPTYLQQLRHYNQTVEILSIAASPNGQRALTGSSDSLLRLWNINLPSESQPLTTFKGHTQRINSVAFNSNGTRALSASDDSNVLMWNLTGTDNPSTPKDERLIATFRTTGAVTSVVFSTDDKRMLTATANGLVQLWNIELASPTFGQVVRTFNGHSGAVNQAVLSGDNQWVVSGSDDQTVRLWQVQDPLRNKGGLFTWVCNTQYARPLTEAERQTYAVTTQQLANLKARCGAVGQPGAVVTVSNAAGVAEAVVASPTLTETVTPDALIPELIESDDARVVATGGWQRMDAVEASGRSYLITGNVGDSLSLTFEGTGVAFIYLSHPAMGSLSIELDGVAGETISLAEGQPELTTYTISGLAFGTHTLRLIVAQGPAVVDAFIVNPTLENPEVTPEVTAEATMEVTAEVTLEVTFTETPTFVPTLTATPTLPPVVILPTATLMLPPIAPPLFASMDDGAAFWTARGGWQLSDTLRYGEAGLGWFAAPEMGTLTWEQPLDLRLSAAPQLRFMSLLNAANGSLAAVEISTDGVNWIMRTVATPSALWQENLLDLSMYRGQVIWIRFTWLWQAATVAETPIDFWVLDAVSVVDVPPVIPTIEPTWTFTPIVEVTPELVVTPTLTLAPTQTLVPVVEVTPEVTADS
ncbi:MAG: TIR domain-containing protein [Anaerolineae bacterium]|nr:TIR domain-containing protein [Anaerolineae bacterium]